MRQAHSTFIPCHQFLTIQKTYGLCLTTHEQKDFFDILSLGAPKNYFNVDQMAKILQVVAKFQYKKAVAQEGLQAIEPKKSQIDRFIRVLQTKLKFAFGTAKEMVQWMDLSGKETVKPEEFLFAVRFFNKGASFSESMLLF